MFERLKETANHSRLVKASGKKTWSALSDIKVILQNLSSEEFMLYDGNIALSKKAYVDYSVDVQQADKLTIRGDAFKVKEVLEEPKANWKFKKLILQKIK